MRCCSLFQKMYEIHEIMVHSDSLLFFWGVVKIMCRPLGLLKGKIDPSTCGPRWGGIFKRPTTISEKCQKYQKPTQKPFLEKKKHPKTNPKTLRIHFYSGSAVARAWSRLVLSWQPQHSCWRSQQSNPLESLIIGF